MVGPAAISIADANAEEGVDDTIDFTVSLDRVALRSITVDYATSDGSATAGEDYEATSGTLNFAIGDRSKTISVPVLDDAKDEAEETFTITLSNAVGAWIEDGEATGTISNSDPLQKAWIARFGRTIASHVVDAVSDRVLGDRSTHVTVAGQRVPDAATVPELEPAFRDLRDEYDLERSPTWRELTMREAMLKSEFSVREPSEDGGPSWGAWGQFATGGFEADVDGVQIQDDVTTAMLGADAGTDDWLAGALVSRSEGVGPFTLTSEATSNRKTGTVNSSMTALYPYGKVRLNNRIDVWALAGLGSGELTIQEDGGTPLTTDIGMAMGAMGLSSQILEVGNGNPIDLQARSDVLWVRMRSEELSGERTLTPSLEVGVRHDAGDAERGIGANSAPESHSPTRASASKAACEHSFPTKSRATRSGARAGRCASIRGNPHRSGAIRTRLEPDGRPRLGDGWKRSRSAVVAEGWAGVTRKLKARPKRDTRTTPIPSGGRHPGRG